MDGSTTVRRDVVVIGGGIMGTATAYQLARAGVSVTLLERGELASGSSGKPLGGVRASFSDPTNIALGQRSLAAFRRFPDEIGVDIGLQQVGYLFAVRDPTDLPAFEASIAVQNERGVPSRLITPAEAVGLCGYLAANELVAAAWSPTDGFARPAAVVHGYATAASALGAQIRTGTTVVGLTATGGELARVETADGTVYETPAVVCTAGAWSAEVGRWAGVALPVTPLRRQIAFTPPLDPRPSSVPFTIDYTSTAYFHGAEDGGLLLGWADPAQASGDDRSVSTDWHDDLRAALRTFAPEVAELPIASGWAGLYEMTPDCNALVGETDAGFRFLYAGGFSGHGFLQGPAVGECLRDLYLGREPVVDVSAFDVARFQRPAVRTELGII